MVCDAGQLCCAFSGYERSRNSIVTLVLCLCVVEEREEREGRDIMMCVCGGGRTEEGDIMMCVMCGGVAVPCMTLCS